MKLQDVAFLLILLLFLLPRNPRLVALLGIISLVFAIPLFQLWIFFTAQRLVLYGFLCFGISLLLHLRTSK